MSRSKEIILNMILDEILQQWLTFRGETCPKMTRNRVLRVNLDLDDEPLSQYFIKFVIRSISRLLDITSSAKLNKNMHLNLKKVKFFDFLSFSLY